MIILQILKPIRIILEVLVVFNLMIIVHELGHFLAARWRGLVIEKFGIWFGKPLWKKKINGVEYSLGSIPAGGFVALPQLAPMEVMEGKVETPREQLPPISALDKIIVAFAGPLFSFLLAVVFSVIVWKVGRPVSEAERTQVVGYVVEDMPAVAAGVKVGDKILQVDGHDVTRFQGMGADSIAWSVVRSEGDTIPLVVEREANGETHQETLSVKPKIPETAHWWNRKNLRTIGIEPAMSSVVAEVLPGTPAAQAQLQKGDIITAVNGTKFYSPDGFYDYMKGHLAVPYQLTVNRAGTDLSLPFEPLGVAVSGVEKDSPASTAGLRKGDLIVGIDDQKARSYSQIIDYVGSRANVPITLHVRRGEPEGGMVARVFAWFHSHFGPMEASWAKVDGPVEDIKVTPQIPDDSPTNPLKKAKIGFVPEQADGLLFEPMGISSLRYPSPAEQLHLSVMAIVNTLDAVFSRKSSVSVQHMGGPVMMMNAYYHMLSIPNGTLMAIWFSVVLNVNLALLNMLPIPVLDGGHITLAIIESIRRKPMNVRILEYVQTACALVIISFMLFIMFFDVQDLPFVGGGRPTMHFHKAGEEAPK